ncbi:MAG: hypothetical protein JSU83_16750 [Deltaproteobacteria bacterium]|nr:MAG: hypothetical protein JSU83_16750 [Deltaproteobacteria bacterium]
MAEKKKKKKWYDTWWGLLYTLAIVDGNPGRGFHRFMEMDRVMGEPDGEENGPIRGSFRPVESTEPNPYLTTSPVNCKT